jgi:TrmH family RNA methyltransferase
VYDASVASPRVIVSRQHPFVQRCRTLAATRDPRAVLLDGEHLIEEALRAGLPFEGVLADARPRALTADIDARGIPRYEATTAVVSGASPVRTSSGIVAIAHWAPAPLADVLVSNPPPIIIGLVGVQDPGNVGSVVRSAHALGATGVLALEGTADPGGWKALRGSMGSAFHLPVAAGRLDEALELSAREQVTVVATVLRDGTPIDRAHLAPPVLIILGNEGRGLDPAILARADRRVSLPMRPGVDSLNVAVSAALILWETVP